MTSQCTSQPSSARDGIMSSEITSTTSIERADHEMSRYSVGDASPTAIALSKAAPKFDALGTNTKSLRLLASSGSPITTNLSVVLNQLLSSVQWFPSGKASGRLGSDPVGLTPSADREALTPIR